MMTGRADRGHSRRRCAIFGLVLAAGMCGVPGAAQGRSITGKLHRFFVTMAFPPNPVPRIAQSNFAEVVTPIVERLALRGIDFPVTSSSPGFTYRFDFDLGALVRSTESFGPIFVERPDTIGRHVLDVGATYLWADVTDFDGRDFGHRIVTRAARTVTPTLGIQQTFAGDDFSLMDHQLLLSATFGLSDRWDVNLLQPLVWTSLHLRGTTDEEVCAVAPCARGLTLRPARRAVFDASAFGLGDMVVRTKYRLSDAGYLNVAALLAVRLPTGKARDLHGLGDSIVTPGLAVAHGFGAHEVHGSLGLDLNADDAERDRARYAVGASVRPFDRLAFVFDVIGSSSFTDDRFGIRRQTSTFFPQSAFGADELIRARTPTELTVVVPRSDVVDLAVGVKVNFAARFVAFTSVIVPLTRDGLRADVIPAIGAEASF